LDLAGPYLLLSCFFYEIHAPSFACHPNLADGPSSIVEVIPTQRATTTIAAPEPPKQAHRVKGVLASPTLLIRRLHIRPNNAITDSTLSLAFQCTLNIPAESNQALDQISRREDDNLNRPHPRLPILVRHTDTVATCDDGLFERVGAR
jgi:hypothetical protein